jgi:hypothetical protein
MSNTLGNTTHECSSLEELLKHSANKRRAATKRAAPPPAPISERCAKRSRAPPAAQALGRRNKCRFDALCLALQRNDTSTAELPPTNIIDWKYPAVYIHRLGGALQQNTRVSVLNLDLQSLVPASFDTPQALNAIGALLRYIRSSNALRSFCIHTNRQPDRKIQRLLVYEMVEAFFENQGGTEKLICECYIPAALFCKSMVATTTLNLKVLHIRFSAYSSDEEQRAIADAFRSSTRLQSLYITTYNDNLMTCILVGLKDAYCELGTLSLRGDANSDAYWDALSDYTHSTRFLKHLELEDQFVGEDLLRCLYGQSSILKLSLRKCQMRHEGMRLLQQFMQARRQGDAAVASSICELAFESMNHTLPRTSISLPFDASRTMAIGPPWPGSLFASMFWTNQNHSVGHGDHSRYSTVGSQIRSLTVNPVSTAGSGFLQALAQNAHRIKFTSLNLSGLGVGECNDLARFISTNSILRELKLHDITNDGSLLRSLRGNGILQAVTMPGKIDSIRANSFCHRYKHLCEVLGSLTAIDLDHGSKVEDRRTISLVPNLMQCAKQVSASCPTMVLSSLLNLGASVGPT